jgi:hypothetical protein
MGFQHRADELDEKQRLADARSTEQSCFAAPRERT